MIKKYRYGTPFPTGATVMEVPVSSGEPNPFQREGNNFIYGLSEEDCVYGLGEAVRGINKRGWVYESCNEDDPIITEKRTALYGAHNFFVVAGKKLFGAFFESADRVRFDVGYTELNTLTVTAVDCDLYVIEGESVTEIVKQFRTLIGKSYIPPRWAFGFGQSRWGYRCEEDIRAVYENYKACNIPLDMIYIDIDYMERYKDFTVNKERYPDFKGLSEEYKAEGVRLIPIIDAGVKVEEGYSVYEEGVKKGYFCKDKNGNPYVVGVWPGESVFPDVLNEEARAWFGEQYNVLLEDGIEGFWNDMNEPSIFYSKHRLQSALEKAASVQGVNMPIEEYQGLLNTFFSLANNREDYKEFYHETPVGRVPHEKVHNLFGTYMTRAAAEYFERRDPDKRYLLFSRSSAVGMHRYGGIWTGDNASWWSHLLLNLKMLPSLNMCGFLYSGADLGGFGDNATEDLLLRWLALGIFTPLMRNHSTLGSRNQEFYLFPKKEVFRSLIEIRYALIPYLYSEFVKCAERGEMLFRPLAFDYPKDRRARVETQLLLGNELMIAPVYEQNADGRYVYLPEEMKMIRMRSPSDYTEEVMEKGDHYIEVALNEVVFFLRKGHVLPLAKPAQSTKLINDKELTFVKFIKEPTDYELYCGTGESKSENAFRIVTVQP